MNYTINVSSVGAVIVGISPSMNSYLDYDDVVIEFNVTGADSVSISFNGGANRTLTGVGSGDEKEYSYTENDLVDGSYGFVIWATDSDDVVTMENSTFVVDTTEPIISAVVPADAVNEDNVNISFKVDDANVYEVLVSVMVGII